jgi:hypothetical protein
MVSLQNTEAVENKLLLAIVMMPRVPPLLLTFTLGLAAGLITASTILRKPVKSKEKVNIEHYWNRCYHIIQVIIESSTI